MHYLLIAGLVLFACGFDAMSAATRKPNILLILADDLGFETVNCYGGTSYKTPNIDALAKSGIRFANGFATPLCSPSRVELMTGRYGFRTGWINLIGRGEAEEVNDYFDPRKERTFAQVLKSAGYATAIAGKWQLCEFQKHPDHANQCGFDESRCWAWQIDGKQTSRYWAPILWENGQLRKLPADIYGDDLFSDFLIDFMKRHKDGPFFAYYPMALVHAPHVPPPGSARAGAAQKAAAKGKKGRGRKAAEQSQDDDTVVNDPANFPDMMAYMDKVVGKMILALDQLHLRENTLVIFTGDNGTDRRLSSRMGDLVIRGGKGTVTEVGAHVPFVASWPGTTPPGEVLPDLIDFSDVLPTLAELGGAQLPSGVTIDGRSFAPQLRGEKGSPRDWVFTQLGHRRFVCDQRYLLHEDGRMYDITNDLLEHHDLAGSTQSEAVAARKRLQSALDRCK
jgi:arylsulfatase A-like enzyme